MEPLFLLASYSINGHPTTAGTFWFGALGIVAFAVVVRLIAGSMDRERIREELEAAGCSVLEITWAPFGKGWLGEKSDRLYEVRYRAADGEVLAATCKTSLFTGVFWSAGGPPTRFARPATAISGESGPGAGVDCPRCGVTTSAGARYCAYCGGKL